MPSKLAQEIKHWLVDTPGAVTEASRRAGVSPSMVYQVLRGDKRSRRVHDVLASMGAPGFAVMKEKAHGKLGSNRHSTKRGALASH